MRFATDNPPESVTISLEIYTGAQHQYYQMVYTFSTGVLQVYRYNNTLTSVYTYTVMNNLYTFNYLKVVGDGSTGKYHRVIINGIEIDLSAYTAHYSASSTAPRVIYMVYVKGNAADNDYLYVDNLIVTTREPVN